MVDIHPEHARAVLEYLSVGIVLVDRRERINWVNGYTATLLDTPPAALLGQDAVSLPLPYTPFDAAGDGIQVRVDGSIIGITQRYDHPAGAGAILTLVERGHTLVGVLDALASGMPDTVAASGAMSRVATRARLDIEISRSRRYANELSCIALRLRGADCAARSAELARVIKGQLRWVDMLGEWQDDALLLVLPETDAIAAGNLRGKLAASIRRCVQAATGPFTIELGISTWRRGDNADQLVRRALTEVNGITLAAWSSSAG